MDMTRKYDHLLFNYETTSRTDYRDGEIMPLVKTVYRAKKKLPRPCYTPLKDIHALTAWRDPNVPFDLFHKPDPIIRKNPGTVQKKYTAPIDVERELIQKTRPRVVMTPALALDRVEEPDRKKFVDHIYCSEAIRAMNDAVKRAYHKSVRAPLPDLYAPSNPVTVEPLIDRFVSPEWRMDSVSWDNRQLRTYTEPTKTFWLTKKPGTGCSVCEAEAVRQAIKKSTLMTST